MCFSDIPSCTGSSIATGQGFHSRQVVRDKAKKQPIGPSGLLGEWAAG